MRETSCDSVQGKVHLLLATKREQRENPRARARLLPTNCSPELTRQRRDFSPLTLRVLLDLEQDRDGFHESLEVKVPLPVTPSAPGLALVPACSVPVILSRASVCLWGHPETRTLTRQGGILCQGPFCSVAFLFPAYVQNWSLRW